MKIFHYNRVIYNVSDLKLESENPFLFNLFEDKQFLESQEIFNNEVEHFGQVTPPFITADGNILSGHRSVKAAKDLGLEEIEVIKVYVPQDELPRFINFQNFDKQCSAATRWKTFLSLRGYLGGNPYGQAWMKEIKELLKRKDPSKYYDITDVIGALTGNSGDKVKMWLTVGSDEGGLLEKIDNGELSLRECLEKVKAKRKNHTNAPAPVLVREPEVSHTETPVNHTPDDVIQAISNEGVSNEIPLETLTSETTPVEHANPDEMANAEGDIDNDIDSEFYLDGLQFDFDYDKPIVTYRAQNLEYDFDEFKVHDGVGSCQFRLKNGKSSITITITNPHSLLED